MPNHLDNFGTNLTSTTNASDTTSPVNSVPSIAAPFWIAFDATNINGHYEVKQITSKTATNILHSALSYDHTIDEEVRIVNPAEEFDALSTGWQAAPGTWTYATADSPTFTLTTSLDMSAFIGVGARIKLTQTTAKYFIVTAISGTTITLYGGTDYTLTAAAITLPYFSIMKSPIGFPLDPTKWTVSALSDTSQRTQATPTLGTWYNVGSLTFSAPIGVWNSKLQCCLQSYKTAATNTGVVTVTVSTANNTESDTQSSGAIYVGGASSTMQLNAEVTTLSVISVATKTSYYINLKNTTTQATQMDLRGDITPTLVKLTCAYL